MKTAEAIKARRSIKHYDASHAMSQEDIDQILSLAILSPTAFNLEHWRFVVVDDVELRQKIRAESWGQTQVTDSSLFIVLCADVKTWETPERCWEKASQEVKDRIFPAIDAFYLGKDQVQRDEAMRSCGIAAQTIMLAAKTLGYDSCPMVGFDFDKVAELIKLPKDHVVAMFVAIGKGIEPAKPKAGQLSLEEVVVKNTFS